MQVIETLPWDAARRQLFVPLQLLQQHGSGMEEVYAGKQTPQARAAIDQLIGEAREHLKTAFELLAGVPPEVRPVFLPLALVRRDLKRMSRADSDPFVPRPPSRLRTLWTLWRASRRGFGGNAVIAGCRAISTPRPLIAVVSEYWITASLTPVGEASANPYRPLRN